MGPAQALRRWLTGAGCDDLASDGPALEGVALRLALPGWGCAGARFR